MFCPKCGIENPDANKFCRACREPLLVIAQAMKKRLPVMIVSQLDAALEKLSERFRRDSILWLVLGVGMAISASFHLGRPMGYRFEAAIALIGFLLSGWSYLIYRRSLALGERAEAGQFISESLVGNTARTSGNQTLNLFAGTDNEGSRREADIIFCPSCGANAGKRSPHCPSCGAGLRAVRKALEPGAWRARLDRLLDSRIERMSDKTRIRQNASGMIWMSGLYSLLGFFELYENGNPMYLLLGFMFLATALWYGAASRRWFPAQETKSGTHTVSEAGLVATAVPTTNELSLPAAQTAFSVTETTTRKLAPVPVQSPKDPKDPKNPKNPKNMETRNI